MSTAKTGSRSPWIPVIAAVASSLALTGLIAALGPRLAAVPHLPDQGSAWYFWKLPAPTFWSRLVFLGPVRPASDLGLGAGGALHAPAGGHGKKRTRINIAFFAVNLLFILLHVLQTHIWYDGLAQDVPIWTSQYSVIVMLVIMLFMLNPRSGLYPRDEVPLHGGGAALREQVARGLTSRGRWSTRSGSIPRRGASGS